MRSPRCVTAVMGAVVAVACAGDAAQSHATSARDAGDGVSIEPEAAQTAPGEAETVSPGVSEPSAEPGPVAFEAAEPEAPEPEVWEPDASEPDTSEPEASEPGTSEPLAPDTEPETLEPEPVESEIPATDASGVDPADAVTPRLPAANAGFDYQIGGAYDPPTGVEVVSRDRNDPPATGLYNICYVNGFQTQPDEEDSWSGERADLVLRDEAGDPIIDQDWGEALLDTRTDDKRARLADIVGSWIRGCADEGYDAVEVDNLDSYGRSGGLLTQDDNVAFMTRLSTIAHEAGLAIGQKNSTELLSRVNEMGTDFAVAEECNRYDECGDYRTVYGDLVFVIEYRGVDFERGCSDFPELSIVLRDLGVSTPSSGAYVYDGC